MSKNSITSLRLRNFTTFADLSMDFSEGINVFIGENGSGKTHILKTLYAASDITRTESGRNPSSFPDTLVKVFAPLDDRLGRLVRRRRGVDQAQVDVGRADAKLNLSFTTREADTPRLRGMGDWNSKKMDCVLIPVQEMLSHSPGFMSLYDDHRISFDGTYRDIIQRALIPLRRGAADLSRQALLDKIRKAMGGTVQTKGEQFFLKDRHGVIEYSLVAEGLRKLGLIWVLIQNGTLQRNSVLFWDEPEANLNPKLVSAVVDIVLVLQRQGTQVFVATHDYSVLKWFHVLKKDIDQIRYVSLKQTSEGVTASSTEDYYLINPNPIAESFDRLYEASVASELERQP
ncbi:MAG TPA: AAA family ATPase [bacterium]